MPGLTRTILDRAPVIGVLQGIPLEQALMCATCDFIYPAVGFGNNSSCPNCASKSYLKLYGILNRTSNEEIGVQKISHVI